jgi:hypothetical protein
MNQRIKELAEQAAVNDMVNNFNGEDYTVRMPSETWAGEFAELIVRECMEWCDAHATIDGTAQQIRDDIKKHFGVE